MSNVYGELFVQVLMEQLERKYPGRIKRQRVLANLMKSQMEAEVRKKAKKEVDKVLKPLILSFIDKFKNFDEQGTLT